MSKKKEPFKCEVKSELKNIVTREDDLLVTIDKARISYPHIFREDPNPTGQYASSAKGKLTCTFYITEKDWKKIWIEMNKFIKEKNPSLDGLGAIGQNYRRMFRKGEMYELRTSSNDAYPPKYYDADGKLVPDPIEAGAERVLTSGNYANIMVSLKLGRSAMAGDIIYSSLIGIQYAEQGEPLGGGVGVDDETVDSAFGAVSVTNDFNTASNGDDEDLDSFDFD